LKESVAVNLVLDELRKAEVYGDPLLNFHNGYAVLLEELDELWDEIKKKSHLIDNKKLIKEATQIGAMALRFLIELC